MFRIFGIVVAVLVVIVVGATFGRDLYDRHLISQRLDSVMSANERAEFRNWNGDSKSFARTLYERCALTQGRGAVQCERYRFALE